MPGGYASRVVRTLATALALNRVLFGIGYLAAPERVGGGWIGRDAKRAGTRVFTRALGARDLVLGAGALRALAVGDAEARRWFAAHALADGTDLAATLVARDDLPERGFRFASAMAAGSTAVAVAAVVGLGR